MEWYWMALIIIGVFVLAPIIFIGFFRYVEWMFRKLG